MRGLCFLVIFIQSVSSLRSDGFDKKALDVATTAPPLNAWEDYKDPLTTSECLKAKEAIGNKRPALGFVALRQYLATIQKDIPIKAVKTQIEAGCSGVVKEPLTKEECVNAKAASYDETVGGVSDWLLRPFLESIGKPTTLLNAARNQVIAGCGGEELSPPSFKPPFDPPFARESGTVEGPLTKEECIAARAASFDKTTRTISDWKLRPFLTSIGKPADLFKAVRKQLAAGCGGEETKQDTTIDIAPSPPPLGPVVEPPMPPKAPPLPQLEPPKAPPMPPKAPPLPPLEPPKPPLMPPPMAPPMPTIVAPTADKGGKTDGISSEDKPRILSRDECLQAQEVIKDKLPLQAEIGLRGFVVSIGKDAKKLKAIQAELANGCPGEETTPLGLPVVQSNPAPAQPLSKDECVAAKDRTDGKQPLQFEIALKGYLKEIGKDSKDKNLVKSVTEQLQAGCAVTISEVNVGQPAVQSNPATAQPLTKEECVAATEATDGKQQMQFEIALKGYLKDIGKDSKDKNLVKSVKEQLQAGCTSSQPEVNQGPKPSPPPAPAVQESVLSNDECLAAKDATDGKQPLQFEIALKGYLQSIGKDSKNKNLLNSVKEQLKAGCVVKVVAAEAPAEATTASEQQGAQALTLQLLQSQHPILEKYVKMKKFGLGKAQVEQKLAMDKQTEDVMKEHFTDFELDCFLKLLFGEVTVCKQEVQFTSNINWEDDRFAKYRRMLKMKLPVGSVSGALTMDTKDLLNSGLTEADISCFRQLLERYPETSGGCVAATAPPKLSLEARNLQLAKDDLAVIEKLKDVPDPSPTRWAKTSFEVTIPKSASTEKTNGGGAGATGSVESVNIIPAKEAWNLNLLVKTLPSPPWGKYLKEIDNGQSNLTLQQLDTIQNCIRYLNKETLEKLAATELPDKLDGAHSFGKALLPFADRLPAFVSRLQCLISKDEYQQEVTTWEQNLDKLGSFYEEASSLLSLLSAAGAGFVKSFLTARVDISTKESEDAASVKEQTGEYDKVLRKFTQAASNEGHVVPLLALFNVVADPSNLLRAHLANKQDLTKFTKRYLDLFLTFLSEVSATSPDLQQLQPKCQALIDQNQKFQPSARNSVRGAQEQVPDLERKVSVCASDPNLPASLFETLKQRAETAIVQASTMQSKVIAALANGAGPFLPTKDGQIDEAAVQQFLSKLPKPGLDEDELRIKGSKGTPAVYSLLDLADDETLRYGLLRFCSAIVPKKK